MRLGMPYQVGIKYSIANTYAHKAVHWYVAIYIIFADINTHIMCHFLS